MPNTELLSPSPREDFPILSRTVHDRRRLVYLDSGVTSQHPKRIIDTEVELLIHHNAPVHRGTHEIAERATDAHGGARETVAGFIGADHSELVFTKNATEALSIVAFVLGGGRSGQYQVGEGDEVVATELGHHASLVPWQGPTHRTDVILCWYGVTEDSRIDMDSLELSEKTKAMVFTHQSNVISTVTDVKGTVRHTRGVGALVIPDAYQSVSHMPVDVKDLDVDFLAFSGRKMLGPSGAGASYGRRELLEVLPSSLTGGLMVEVVTMKKTTSAAPPQCFETDTMVASQIAGLGAAVKYLDAIGMGKVIAHRYRLTALALERLQETDDVTIIGPTTPKQRSSAVSFKVEGIHPHDLGQVLNDQGVCIRIGHHCAWLIRQTFNAQSTAQASFYIYNAEEDVQALAGTMRYTQKFFGATP